MTAHDDLDRQLNDFLRDGPSELPYQSFDAVRDRTEQTRQRVVIGPWRIPEMNKIVTVGLGVAAVVVLVFVGSQLIGTPSHGVGSGASATLEQSATQEPDVSPSATGPAPSPSDPPPLTQSFTSTQHGFSVSYPEGWTAQAATGPWTDSTFPLAFGEPHADFLYDPALESDLFVTIASQPIGDSAPDDWIAEQLASDEGCSTTEPIAVDGAAGLIGAGDCDVAVVTTAGRGYWIQLYTSGDDPLAVAGYDRAWFEELLATVQLHPEEAVD